MASEIEVVTDADAQEHQNSSSAINGVASQMEDEELNLRKDVYMAPAYGDLDKLSRLIEEEDCSLSHPDTDGYYALQWVALNNRATATQYLIEDLKDDTNAST